MPYVLDASVTAAWCFPDEGDAITAVALHDLRNRGAVVPEIWWFEVRNLLVVGERRRRIDVSETAAFLRDLAGLPIVIDRGLDESAILELARQHHLSVYDAAYLELAARLGQPLATLDRKLAGAARRAGIALLAAGPA